MRTNKIHKVTLANSKLSSVSLVKIEKNLTFHAHSYTQIMFWVSGSPAFSNVEGIELTLNSNQGLIMNPWVAHDLQLKCPEHSCLILKINLHDELLMRYSESLVAPYAFKTHTIPTDLLMLSAIAELTRSIDSPQVNCKVLNRDLTQLLMNLNQVQGQPDCADGCRRRRKMFDYRLRQTLDYMRAHIADHFTVDQLAKRVGMSRSRLFQLFHDEMNSTPFTVWNSLRMETAIQQLESMELPIGEIAESIGFTQAGNFSRFFHDRQGLSPRNYRIASQAVSN